MIRNFFMSRSRRTGIGNLGDVRLGGHFCLFYQTPADLMEVLVPYFISGLEDQDLCIWIVPNSLDKEEAWKALGEASHRLDEYVDSGQVSILGIGGWYLTEGKPDPNRPWRELVKSYEYCKEKGFQGVRIAGDLSGIDGLHWKDVIGNHSEARRSLEGSQLLSICCYQMDCIEASDVVEIVQNYQSALFKEKGEEGLVAARDLNDAEKALEESEDRYHRLLELSPEPILIHSGGMILYVNTAGVNLLGLQQREDIMGRSILDFVPVEDRNQIQAHLQELPAAVGNVERTEHRLLRPDGTVLDIEVVAGPATYMGRPARQLVIRDVSRRKREQVALEESEARYRLLAENVTDVICTMDRALNLTYISPSISLITGFSPEEMLGHNLDAMVQPDSFSLARQAIQRHRAAQGSGSAWITDIVAKCKDGGTVCMEAKVSEICDARSNVTGYIAMARDVSERRRVEASLVKSEERFRTIYEKSPTGIAIMDKEGHLTGMNRAFRQLFAFPVNFTPETYSIFSDPNVREHAKQALRSGESISYEGPFDLDSSKEQGQYQTLRKGMRYISLTITPLRGDSESSLTGYLLQMLDITQRKTDEQAVRASEAKYRALFENTLDGNLVIDEESRSIVLANEAMAKMHGFESPRELLGMDPLSFVVPEDRTLVELVIREVFQKKSREVARFRTQTKRGKEIWVSAVGMRTEFEGRPAGFISLRDISDWERSQRKVQDLYRKERKLRHELEDEMQRRADFLRALAHELKTPLTPVLAAGSALVHNLPEGAHQDLAQSIYRGASRLTGRIDELIDLARGEIGLLDLVCEPVDMLEVLQEISKDMDPVFASREQSLVFVLPIDLPRVQADQSRLRQIVHNLLDNACKFTPDGGKITVQAWETDRDIVVRISDTGPGIPRPMRARLFDPYQQLEMGDRRSGGLGTGLALSKRLIELHGGHITVRSREGKGSTFIFSIPIANNTRTRCRDHGSCDVPPTEG